MTYLRPRSLEEALAHLAQAPARLAAGCTDLFPATQARGLAGPILDITGIDGLRGVARSGEGWRIGAATSWSEIIRAELPPAFDALKEAAREVGSVQIQNAGTIGGNLCTASPAADGVPCLMVLDAAVELVSARGTRVLPLADFLTGPRQTALAADELLGAVLVPEPAGASRFLKLGARRYLVISIAMVAARLVVEDGVVRAAAVSVGACGPVAARLGALEEALVGAEAGPGLGALVTEALVAPALAPISDIRADADYRVRAATELVRRAVAGLAGAGEVAA